MSQCRNHIHGMNRIEFFHNFQRNSGELIAAFGQARLIKTPHRVYELHGGSKEDRREAREWISLFLHDAAIQEIRPNSRGTIENQSRGD